MSMMQSNIKNKSERGEKGGGGRRRRLIIDLHSRFQNRFGKSKRGKNETAERLFANERVPNRPLERQFAEDELIKGPELGELSFR